MYFNCLRKVPEFLVNHFNRPEVKENFKKISSLQTAFFGLTQAYDYYQTADEKNKFFKLDQTAEKVVLSSARISLILSACVSRPGVYAISSVARRVFSTGQLNRIFGPNTIFAINPWHPRHVTSIAAVILALPYVAKSSCQISKKIFRYLRTSSAKQDKTSFFANRNLCFMVWFNVLTSRPVLHIGNQIMRKT